jgi:hypothetical protein
MIQEFLTVYAAILLAELTISSLRRWLKHVTFCSSKGRDDSRRPK